MFEKYICIDSCILIILLYICKAIKQQQLKPRDMTLSQATKKAAKTGIEVTPTANGHFFFTNAKTNKKGSAWMMDGEFDLPRKIYNEEEADHADSMNEMFRYLNR